MIEVTEKMIAAAHEYLTFDNSHNVDIEGAIQSAIDNSDEIADLESRIKELEKENGQLLDDIKEIKRITLNW